MKNELWIFANNSLNSLISDSYFQIRPMTAVRRRKNGQCDMCECLLITFLIIILLGIIAGMIVLCRIFPGRFFCWA